MSKEGVRNNHMGGSRSRPTRDRAHLGNTLDVIAKDLAVTLGAALSKAFASFSSSGHGYWWMLVVAENVDRR